MSNLPFDSSAKGGLAQGKPFDNTQGEPDSQPTAKVSGHPEKENLSETHFEEVERAPELTAEVKKAGVEHVEGEIQLTPQDKKVGMEAAAEAVPLTTSSVGTVSLSLTDDQIQKALHQKITESILWLATWCLRQLQLLHHKLKE